MKTIILKNTTISDITIRGKVIPASDQRDFSDFEKRLLIEDADNISSLIDAGDIVVNDGTTDLATLHGKAYLLGDVPPLVFYSESEVESSTTSETYQPKVSLTFTSANADYLVEWYAEIKSPNVGTHVDTRVQEGANVYHEADWKPDGGVNNGYGTISGFQRVTYTAGSKTVDLEYASSNATKTVYIRRARIKIMEVT